MAVPQKWGRWGKEIRLVTSAATGEKIRLVTGVLPKPK